MLLVSDDCCWSSFVDRKNLAGGFWVILLCLIGVVEFGENCKYFCSSLKGFLWKEAQSGFSFLLTSGVFLNFKGAGIWVWGREMLGEQDWKSSLYSLSFRSKCHFCQTFKLQMEKPKCRRDGTRSREKQFQSSPSVLDKGGEMQVGSDWWKKRQWRSSPKCRLLWRGTSSQEPCACFAPSPKRCCRKTGELRLGDKASGETPRGHSLPQPSLLPG